MNELITCRPCRHYGRAPHATPELRADFQYFHQQASYRAPKGCKLTGEHWAPDRTHRCEKFEAAA